MTEPGAAYIFVMCEPRDLSWYYDEHQTPLASHAVYKNFHALVPKGKSDDVLKKVKYWENAGPSPKIQGSPRNRPPNVLVIGMDSVSRLLFRRGMSETIKMLEDMGAHEMLGFTKGTLPLHINVKVPIPCNSTSAYSSSSSTFSWGGESSKLCCIRNWARLF